MKNDNKLVNAEITPEEEVDIWLNKLSKFFNITYESIDFVCEGSGIQRKELHITGKTFDSDIRIIIPNEAGFLNALSAYLSILHDKKFDNA